MTLIKSALVKKIHEKNIHLFERDAERIVSVIFNEITQSLADGKRVELRGFGAFSVSRRKRRRGRNPRTGETVIVEDKVIPKWKMGKELRIKLNNKDKSETEQIPDH
tara:strand:+ start:148 stop:468 length:321 start_codon:yes stop_codon:yes gene_type:complete